MKNRAKCKLCNDVIESKHGRDYVECSCGEISIDGGNESYKASAVDWKNFIRVDDQNNEILVQIIDRKEEGRDMKPTRKEILEQVNNMIQSIEGLPSNAMQTSINHYDYLSILILLSGSLQTGCCDCKESN